MSGTTLPSQVGVAIIGAGIVGLAIALEITSRFPGKSVVVLEKEPSIARHQTGHNSGVIHSGIYYKPGSLKARLCVEGAEMLMGFCKENGIPFEACGKLIVATSENEFPQLEELYRRGQGNRLNGVRLLGAGEIHEFEPHAAGLRGIYVPSTGIVDFREVAEKYAALIALRGGLVLLSHEVTALKRAGTCSVVETTKGTIEAELVVNCAGLQSDRISRMANARLDLTIVPFRGEYFDIVPAKRYLVRSLLYPVPDPRFPFLGVHFTRRSRAQCSPGPQAGRLQQDFHKHRRHRRLRVLPRLLDHGVEALENVIGRVLPLQQQSRFRPGPAETGPRVAPRGFGTRWIRGTGPGSEPVR